MPQKTTRVDQLLYRAKNHPTIAVVITSCIGLLALSGFVEAIGVIGAAAHSGYAYFIATPSLPTPEEKKREYAISVMADYLQVPRHDFKVVSLQWIDLLGTGDEYEFYICYLLGDLRYVSVYSVRSPSIQRLFCERSNATNIEHVTYENKACVVMWCKEGSGAFLSLKILSWDGVGPLNVKYPSEENEANDYIFQGNLFIVDNQIYVSGNGQKFQLINEDGTFKWERYRLHPRFPDHGAGVHVLRIQIKKDLLVLLFDNEELGMVELEERKYGPTCPIRIGVGESVLIDDNLEEPRSLRILCQPSVMEWKLGLYPEFLARSEGVSEIYINDSYGPWYQIQFDAKGTWAESPEFSSERKGTF